MANRNGCSGRTLKICFCTTAIFLIIVAIIFTTLAFTVFKPKDPEVFLHLSGLENIQLGNMTLNVTLNVIITIENPNYGSFKFKNSTGYVDYHGDFVADIPIEEDLVPAKGKINIKTSADLMLYKIIMNPEFLEDLFLGSLNFTSNTVLHGKVSVLKVFNLHGTTITTCDISLFLHSHEVQSTCTSKIKL